MKRIYSILLIFLLIISSGCQQNESAVTDSKTSAIAKEYLEKEGYEVLSYENLQESYTLTKKKLETLPYQFYWMMPGNDSSPHIGKTVDVEKFLVRNHPLDDWECCGGIKAKGKVYTYVYVVEGKVIGGTSFPYGAENSDLGGGYWSLDGRTDE
ncbi:hypothetical protein FZC79_15385 [Rossellomorea vietnamensis]|uniref:DUF4830 domain-containing protein n=2 Tax=Rossellomorea TaxID=2837508 RepID=A0A5D4KB55_9BACI|nr:MULTISPECIES: hypothetical protein [Rossellomorea]TYR74196.1 hypothetical protein FZC79_15385 [Rossellomorea vietnamensis]TYS79718.1 hypothetical protein FZC80_08725 [Rossellomorea aquimaris]